MLKYTLTLILLAAITSGCQKAIDAAINNTLSSEINAILQNGYWTVTRYSEGPKDSTSIFTNWRTYFGNNNTMYSVKGSPGAYTDSTAGTWSSNDLSHFICTYNVGVKYPLTKISDTWSIDMSYTPIAGNKIGLFRTVNGRADTLQMIKN